MEQIIDNIISQDPEILILYKAGQTSISGKIAKLALQKDPTLNVKDLIFTTRRKLKKTF